ncbi:MAG: glycosyltransferase family 39 protein [Chloroflexia bacterium]|nr:glycosyltransferase family 39 protein [Chloroflexia bacterium]
MKGRRRTQRFLLLSALVTALLGQYYFRRLPERFWDGVFFYGLAVLCLAWLLALREDRAEKSVPLLVARLRQALQDNLGRVWLLLAAAISSYTALRLLDGEQYAPAVLFWLLSIGLGLAAWLAQGRPTEALDPIEDGIALDRGEWLLLGGLALLALLLRLPRLGTIPFVISGDEASMGIEALHVLEGSLRTPFSTGWLSHPTLYFFLMAGPLALLGRNAWGLRLLSPLVGSATIPVLYLLARRLFDRRVALAGALLLAASHLHIHFSRLAINNIYDPLWGLLAFLFFFRGLQQNRRIDWALSGLALGLSQYFYMGGRLLPVILAIYLGLRLWQRPIRLERLWTPLAALGSTFLLTLAPLLRSFLRHPENFMARIRMVGIIQSGWLQSEPQVTGKSALELLWLQFRKSILAFNYTLDPTSWYAADIPYLDFVSAIFFVLGLVFLLRYWRRRGFLWLNAWFWPAVLIGGMLIENPPSSPRFVIFTPAVCLIAALGLIHCLDLLAELTGLPAHWARLLLVLLLLLALGLNLHYYFFQYTPAGLFGGSNTEVGTRVGEYLSEQPPGFKVYFFGPPRMWVGYATIPFLVPNLDAVDVEPPLSAPPTFIEPDKAAILIFLPERQAELQWVRQAYPNGERRVFYGHHGEILFVSYEIR